MPGIFISYRREDSAAIAGWIHEILSDRYEDSVFIDVENVPVAENIRDAIETALRQCRVVVAIIGSEWLGAKNDGTMRINEEADWVRLELAIALRLSVPVIPVLVQPARMPSPNEVPSDVRSITGLSALTVKAGSDFKDQVNRLMDAIDRKTGAFNDRMPVRFERRRSNSLFEALLSIGKVRIAISITTVCALFVAFVVFRDLLLPDVQLRTDERTDFSELLATRQTLSLETFRHLQEALCVPNEYVGQFNNATRELVRIYKDSERSRSEDQSSTKLSDRDVQKLLSMGPCERNKFKNYFERQIGGKTAQTIAQPKIIDLLNQVAVDPKLPVNASEADVRARIVALRRILGSTSDLRQVSPEMADQLTPDLLRALTR